MKKFIAFLIICLSFLIGCKEELKLLEGTWICDNQITLNFTEYVEYKHGNLKWCALYGERIEDNYSYISTCYMNNPLFFSLIGNDISETCRYKYYAYCTVQKNGVVERIDELYFNLNNYNLEGIYRTDDMFGWSDFEDFEAEYNFIRN